MGAERQGARKGSASDGLSIKSSITSITSNDCSGRGRPEEHSTGGASRIRHAPSGEIVAAIWTPLR